MTKKIDYSTIKKSLWEAWRAFFPAIVVTATAQLSVGADGQDAQVWLRSVAIASVLAGVRAVAKWLREKHPGEYQRMIFKLPI